MKVCKLYCVEEFEVIWDIYGCKIKLACTQSCGEVCGDWTVSWTYDEISSILISCVLSLRMFACGVSSGVKQHWGQSIELRYPLHISYTSMVPPSSITYAVVSDVVTVTSLNDFAGYTLLTQYFIQPIPVYAVIHLTMKIRPSWLDSPPPRPVITNGYFWDAF
jgi:hypothetical protein